MFRLLWSIFIQETKSEAGGTSSGVTTHPQKKTTPTEEMTTPTRDSMSGGNSNKTEESDNPQQPVTSLHNKTQSTSPSKYSRFNIHMYVYIYTHVQMYE